MDRSSLIVVVMPITTLIALFTGMALPFVAASRSGRSHAGGGWHPQMRGSGPGRRAEGRRRNPALMTPPPPDTCTSPAPATPDGYSGRDTPLGPAGADRQEDGQADLLHQRQLGPARGRRQPRLHQPRTVRDRHPVPR